MRTRSLVVLIAVGATAAVLAACGSRAPNLRRSGPAVATVSPLSVGTRPVGRLPEPVEDAAVASLSDRRVVLLGGLDAADDSTASVTMVSIGGLISPAGALPIAQHDAQAAMLGGALYVFGGGEVASYDHILRYDPATSAVTTAGALPTAASDVAVAAFRGVAYVVGGYDGSRALDTIVAWSPGSAPRVVGHLPTGLRYAAVANADGRLIIAGGTTPVGLSDAILSFDPGTGTVTKLGSLPTPLTHASAAVLHGEVVVIGGRRQLSGAQTSSILAIDPASGAARRVGVLPQPLSDAAVAQLGSRVVVAGGESPAGAQSQVMELTASPTR